MLLNQKALSCYHVQSYAPAPLIDGVQFYDLKRFQDDGGSFTELARLSEGFLKAFAVRQINYSEIEPGVIKAFHLHREQTDIWYVPASDRILVVLVDVRSGSPTEGQIQRLMTGNGTSRLVGIPPGVAHGARNLASTTGRLIYFVDRHFNPDPSVCDEGRLPWDFVGPDVWEPVRG